MKDDDPIWILITFARGKEHMIYNINRPSTKECPFNLKGIENNIK